jgi:hypothetical protein
LSPPTTEKVLSQKGPCAEKEEEEEEEERGIRRLKKGSVLNRDSTIYVH